MYTRMGGVSALRESEISTGTAWLTGVGARGAAWLLRDGFAKRLPVEQLLKKRRRRSPRRDTGLRERVSTRRQSGPRDIVNPSKRHLNPAR